MRRLLPAMCTAALIATALGGWTLRPEEGRKIALIIAISDYGTPPDHPETGEPLRPYRYLNALNDVPLVRGALEHHGFQPEDIRVLRDGEADANGIRDAFRWLVRETGEGDVVVLHYSGHGHRLTNDNPGEDDEVDGYDELLVPHGAPDEFYEGYDGSLHIRDDELGELVMRLRERAGRTGNVTVFLDACYSGTGTRGGPELPARGSETPLGPPQGASAADGDGTGIDRVLAVGTRGDRDALAPFAVFSAASQRQVAYETYDVDGETKVGSLSYALARALPEAMPGTTYRSLFADITRSLSGKVRQTPQMEGTADAQLFSNLLSQQLPYIEVGAVGAAGSVSLRGGSLLGLNPGTQLLVHESGAARPDAASALATLVVRESAPTEATAEVVSGQLAESASGAWAFVTDRTYGDLALRVRLDASLRERDRSGLERAFTGAGIIDLVDDGADVVVADFDGLPEARTVDDLTLALGAVDVVRVVEDFARNRYLRRLDFEDAEVVVELDFAPVEIERNLLGRATGCAPPVWDAVAHPRHDLGGGQWRLAPGDAYRLQARNLGEHRFFVAVLDLLPRGAVQVLRPREDEAPSSYELDVGATLDLGCYQITDELGLEVVKLFGTRTPQDFRAMFETRGTRGAAGGDLSALEAVLATTFTGTRSSQVSQPSGAATTESITIDVRSN